MAEETLSKSNDRRDRLKTIGYIAFGGFAFLLSLYLTFPAEAVGQRIAHEIQKGSGGKLSVTFEDISLYRFTGVEAENLKLKTSGEDPVEVTLDVARARLNILPLLWLTPVVDAEVELGDSLIEVEVEPEGEGYAITAEIDDLDFASPPILPKMASFPFGGVLSGKLEGTWHKDVTKAKAKASMTIRTGSVGPGEVKMGAFGAMALPRVGLGQLDLAVDLQSGRLRLASFQQKADEEGAPPSLELRNVSATAMMRSSMRSSSYDLCIELKPDDAFLEKNKKLGTALELAQMQLRKDPEGYLHIPLKGSMSGAPKPRRALCSKTRRGAPTPPEK